MASTKLPQHDYDIIIIGGGPAGFTAGIYAARAGLKTLLLEGASTVSQITITDLIENYPGIPDGINGLDLMQLFKSQALKFGLEILSQDTRSISKSDSEPALWIVNAGDKSFQTLSIIAATGAQWRKLGVPGETEFAGKGVSYCATCDGAFFRNQRIAVIGGGNSALQEAVYLSRFASEIYLIHRRDAYRASKLLQERISEKPVIKPVLDTIVTKINGKDKVESVLIKNVKTDKATLLPLEGVFVAVGHTPNTAFCGKFLKLDGKGYIITDEALQTSVPGVFAAGDCRVTGLRQVATAVGDGAYASESIDKLLQKL